MADLDLPDPRFRRMRPKRMSGWSGAKVLAQVVDAKAIDSAQFDFEMLMTPLGASFVSQIRMGPTRITEMRAPLGPDFLHFVFLARGESLELWEDGCAPLRFRQGSAAVVPGEVRLSIHAPHAVEVNIVSLAASNLSELLPDQRASMMSLSESSALLAPTRAFIEAFISVQEPPTSLARYAGERVTHELLSAIVLDTEGFSGPINGANEQVRERVVALIAEAKNDPTLSVDRLAAEVAVSVRHLQRIFRESGTTVTKEIRKQRAWAAHAVLTQSKYDVLSIEQVAQRSGFTDAKDLRRALAQFFDLTPRQVRQGRAAVST